MANKRTNKLINDYQNHCNEIVEEFCKKQEMDFNGWIGDRIGEIAYCSDFFLNLSDIVFDLSTNQPKGKIIDWYYESVDKPKKTVNYQNWTKLNQNGK